MALTKSRPEGTLAKLAGKLSLFVLFSTVYYLPLLLDASALYLDDMRLKALIGEVLANEVVQFEIARNVLAHVAPLFLCYVLLLGLAYQLSFASGLSVGISIFFYLTTGLMLLASVNAALFPTSDYSHTYSFLGHPEVGIILFLLFLAPTLYGFCKTRYVFLNRRGATLLLASVGIIGWATGLKEGGEPVARGRNIIVLGIDSLSASVFESHRTLLPNVSSLLSNGIIFDRAYTPLARTFPAWLSILSGLPPAEHGGVFNLRDTKKVMRDDLVTQELRAKGYETIFALDERRFSHIDESFGFDRVVGPKIGALDFLVQRINDTPITNLMLQTSLSNLLLPFSSFNTASHANYDAAGFVDAIVAGCSGRKPLFLATHFESAHFPYKSRHAVIEENEGQNLFLARHLSSLTTVDAQVGTLLKNLQNRGFLDDALVVLLSDHGEGLGEIETRTTQGGAYHEIVGYGHGGNVLSEQQNRVLLGLVQFRHGRPTNSSSTHVYELFSLTEIRKLLTLFADTGNVLFTSPQNKCVISETGVRFRSAENYKTLNPAAIAAETASYYRIDESGKMELREDRLMELLKNKDISIRCAERMTYFSSLKQRYFSYALEEGGNLRETSPVIEDVKRIELYRRKLLLSAAQYTPQRH